MKLSNKGRYAVRALFDIAFYNQGRPTQVRDIAERQAIPPRFLEQIFQDLKKAQIVGSKRGPQGGYSLLTSPESVRLGDVIRAVEGPITLGGEKAGTPRQRKHDSVRVTEAVFQDLATQIEGCFNSITLADLCAKAHKLGVSPGRPGRYAYVI